MPGYAYILRCADGSYYVGSTRSLPLRVEQHNAGVVDSYTRARRPVKLVWWGEFEHIGTAWEMEQRLKGWSRAKKEALIEGRFEDLPKLSRRGGQRMPEDSAL
jgi:putative endonuclease